MDATSRIALIGSLGRDKRSLDGQTLRTQLVLDELKNRAVATVNSIDTAWLARRPIRVLWQIYNAFRESEVVLIMPGERGLRYLLPMYIRLASAYGCSIHYLVVGGWLPEFVRKHLRHCKHLEQLDGIFVQSPRMITALQSEGLNNVHFLPNFKSFRPTTQTCESQRDRLSLVFLSRLIPEKGVEHCIEAIKIMAGDGAPLRVQLDIWGTAPEKHKSWLERLHRQEVDDIFFKGAMDPETVVSELSNYDAMLFPTWYRGEGFAGVLIDAFAAGIPVVASDWHDNAEFVTHMKTGIIFETGSIDQLVDSIRLLRDKPALLQEMKRAAATRVAEYHVDVVLPPLLRQLGIAQI